MTLSVYLCSTTPFGRYVLLDNSTFASKHLFPDTVILLIDWTSACLFSSASPGCSRGEEWSDGLGIDATTPLAALLTEVCCRPSVFVLSINHLSCGFDRPFFGAIAWSFDDLGCADFWQYFSVISKDKLGSRSYCNKRHPTLENGRMSFSEELVLSASFDRSWDNFWQYFNVISKDTLGSRSYCNKRHPTLKKGRWSFSEELVLSASFDRSWDNFWQYFNVISKDTLGSHSYWNKGNPTWENGRLSFSAELILSASSDRLRDDILRLSSIRFKAHWFRSE